MNIVEALDDPSLFGGMFDGVSWRTWRTFLKASVALPLDAAEMVTYRHHTGRTEAPTKPARYIETVVGRRGGKSRVLALIASFTAAVIDHAPYLVPGEIGVIAIIARDRDQAKVILSYIRGFLQAVPLFQGLIEDESAETIRLTNGVEISVQTASLGSPRGRTFIAVLCDETAFWPVGDSANPDAEVINAVRPGLATIPYSLLLIASSPYAKRGVLYTNYAKYFGKSDAPVLVWQGTTEEMNPNMLGDDLIAEMYAEDPERASAEFGAQFRTDIVAFITREAVEDCLARDVRELPASSGTTYVGHVDPSGGSADSMTLAIAHLNQDGIAVLDAIREVKPPFSPDGVVQEFATLLKSYNITRVTGDAYAGEWPRERFAVHGIAYDVSKKSASTIYAEFLPALNARRVQLLDLPRLIGQLVGLERRTARAGRDSIAHAPGSHDDVANVGCGALVQVIEDRRPSLISKSDLVVAGRGTEHPSPALVFATVWVGIDGMAAWGLFTYQPNWQPETVLADFDKVPWSAAVLTDVAQRVDQLCEAGRNLNQMRGVDALLHVPAQLYEAGLHAMTGAFADRFNRVDASHRQIYVLPIGPSLLADPAGLVLHASAHISMGRLKLGEAALRRSEGKPLLGTLALRPGERVETDALRVALLVGMAEMNDASMQTDGAALHFG